ncbi:hypothetical protein BDR03DRAFT_1010557 [Suillus americanus]|nr:hypothetical protein BDR03DRAFT_1010557 [Suillus americanus]
MKTWLLNTGPEASVELEDSISSQMESRDIQLSKEVVELMEEMDSMLMFDNILDSESESEPDSDPPSLSDESDSEVISLDESSFINISTNPRVLFNLATSYHMHRAWRHMVIDFSDSSSPVSCNIQIPCHLALCVPQLLFINTELRAFQQVMSHVS